MRAIAVAFALLILSLVRAQETVPDVIYDKEEGCAFTLDVYKPKTPNHKAIVWIESFEWYSFSGLDPDFAKKFTDRGFTFFEVFHGSRPRFTVVDSIPMAMRAIRFIRSKATSFGIDPDAIGVCGASSGGNLALDIGCFAGDGVATSRNPIDRVSDRANAIVAFFAPSDFLNWGGKGITPLDTLGKPRTIYPAFGITALKPEATMREIGHDTSPIYFIRHGFPPTLLIHGDTDKVVPLQQSVEFDKALEAASIDHKLVILKGLGYADDTIDKGLPQALDWFDQHLKVRY